jgi:hypothetical protein
MQRKAFQDLERLKAFRRKAVTEGSDMAEVVDILDPIFQKDCKKIDVQMVDWMMQQALDPTGKRRANGLVLLFYPISRVFSTSIR